jgi:hypothetical protein
MVSKPREEKLTGRRVRRNYTEEFRRDAVCMIEREGLTAAEVPRHRTWSNSMSAGLFTVFRVLTWGFL